MDPFLPFPLTSTIPDDCDMYNHLPVSFPPLLALEYVY